MNAYVKETVLLDFTHKEIANLAATRGWLDLAEKERIREVYNFVRDEISFGFNREDALPSSRILKDGYGQCNTKSILFMSLLRAVRIPCRLHGFTVTSDLQKGVLTGVWFALRPKELIHTWVEVFHSNKWYNIEGFILDTTYLTVVQKKFNDCSGGFCGYGIAVKDLQNPQVNWNENDTYIQKEGIIRDFGVFDDPDVFFREHRQQLKGFEKFLYSNIVRHLINRNIRAMRRS